MTRIILQWMLIFIIGGILLLVSGESTAPTFSEEKTPNSVTTLILSSTGNTSSEISSNTVVSKTENSHEEPENLLSTTSNFELDEASNTSESPLGGSKIHNFVPSSGLSTDVLTTLLSTDPSSEGSKLGSSTEVLTRKYEDQEKMASTPKDMLTTEEDHQEAEVIVPSSSSEVSETSTNILTNLNEIQSENESFTTKNNEPEPSKLTEYSIPPSSVPKFSTEVDATDLTLIETSTSDRIHEVLTTKAGSAEYKTERQSPTHMNRISSDGNTIGSTSVVYESTNYLETETIALENNADKTTSGDLSTENSLSLHKTTPKSATKKRSLNNTGDSMLYRESTAASKSLGSTSLEPELTTLLERGDLSTVSEDRLIISPNASEAIVQEGSNKENAENSSSEPLMIMSMPSVSSEYGIFAEKEKMEQFGMPHMNSKLSANEKENDKETNDAEMETEKFQSDSSVNILKTSDDDGHLNNLDNIDHSFSGVTFDPDGMKNDGPQDPDSIVFYVPSTNYDKASTPENTYPSVAFTGHENSESEREFEFVTHKNLMEGGSSANGTGESERMEYIPHDKSIAPQPSHKTMDSSEIETFETANNSNTSAGFVFWDPSNGGWILPATSTDSPIKRMDTELSDESEEMLQDAPHFADDSDRTRNKVVQINPSVSKSKENEKDETKSTKLEAEAVTELGFSNSFVPHLTDQSVIRPVKVKLTSPDDKSVSTSILPESLSTLTTEQPAGLKLSEPTKETITGMIETSSTNTSSPMILPNPAPSVITEVVTNPELSTIYIQPELVPVSLDKSIPAKAETSNSTSVANSTIAGIAVKTSVSVSLPLSKTKNDAPTLSPAILELMKSLNVSSLSINGSTISILPESVVPPSSPPVSDSSTDGLTTTSAETTTAPGIKILKPKIKIPGGANSGPNTRRPYRPFIPAAPRPTTTAGPPVSIFRKQRTRIASITSSTTARPLRSFTGGNFATIRIQYASDIPGLLPQEFLISTEPVTTTTTEPTTTEELISEVPFTDQTHIPTVTNEDDVTLVKVAGYVAIDRGLRWNDLLHNRHSPEYKRNAEAMHLYLDRMFRSSPIASRLWKIEIDGFSGNKKTRPVGIDFFLYLIKTQENIPTEHLAMVFHDKLSVNNTFGTFRVDPSKTFFEMIKEEPLKAPTPPPEEDNVEPPIPQWAIAVIVIGAASLIFIVLFAAVTIYGRHHMRRRYSSKLNEEDMERSSGEWESKMAAAYENMAADTIYDAEDLHSDSYKKNSRIATFHGIPSTLKRCDSWSSNGWTTPPKRKRPHVH